MVRLPVGDWTLRPYGPYIGCMDGAADRVQWMLDTCAKYNIQVLVDVHAMKDSQNGFDNGGQAMKVEWKNETHFSHWPNREANWMGNWNMETSKYDALNFDNLNHALEVAEGILGRWGSHSAFGAFEPINEPWENTDLDVLKDFYRKVRKMVQRYAPQAHFVFHDSFHFEADTWNDLFADDDVDKVAIDHHKYQAWNGASNDTSVYCDDYETEA